MKQRFRTELSTTIVPRFAGVEGKALSAVEKDRVWWSAVVEEEEELGEMVNSHNNVVF